MKDHSWAFAAWEYERLKGNINSDSLLLHFDYHLDDLADGLFVDGVFKAETKQQLFSVIRTNEELYSGEELDAKIQYDNFIWPSFARGTIGSMFVIAPQEQEDFATWILSEELITYEREDIELEKEKILSLIPIEKFKSVYRASSLQEFKERYIALFQNSIVKRDRILDIDLDYFNPTQSLYEAELMPDTEIREIISELLELCDWDLITVALSPTYCGRNDNAEHLLKLFMDVAKLEF